MFYILQKSGSVTLPACSLPFFTGNDCGSLDKYLCVVETHARANKGLLILAAAACRSGTRWSLLYSGLNRCVVPLNGFEELCIYFSSPLLCLFPPSPTACAPPPPPMADVVVSFDCIGKLQWYSKHPERYDDKWVQIPVNYFLLKSKFHSVCC